MRELYEYVVLVQLRDGRFSNSELKQTSQDLLTAQMRDMVALVHRALRPLRWLPMASALACGAVGNTEPAPPETVPTSAGAEGDDGLPGVDPGSPRGGSTLTPAGRMLAEANRMLSAVRHTRYAHHSFVDEATGTFELDCSGFVDYVAQHAVTSGYGELVLATKPRPVAASWVQLASAPRTHWSPVANVGALVPGDVVAWLEPARSMSTNTGHVMIVAQAPTRAAGALTVDIAVIDSTEAGHGPGDSRTPAATTGLGHGVIRLGTDAAGVPHAWHWSTQGGSRANTTTIALLHAQ